MKKQFALFVMMSMLAGLVSGCEILPVPTLLPATQTPWIIVVTATANPDQVAQATQTPRVVVVTATLGPPQPAGPTETPKPTATATRTKPAATPTLKPTPKPTTAAAAAGTATQAPTVAATTQAPAGTTPGAATSTTQPQPTSTTLPVTPTNTPIPGSLRYAAPTLLEPPDGVTYGPRNTVTLEWTPVGALAQDEYYHLHLEAFYEATREQFYGDYVFTKDTVYLLDQSFLAPFHPGSDKGSALVYWWVRVVRKVGDDANGKPEGVDVGASSEKRYFVCEPSAGP